MIFFLWSRKEFIFGEWWDRGKSSFEKRGIGLENHKNTSQWEVIDKGFIERFPSSIEAEV